jgi:hypothetical protein
VLRRLSTTLLVALVASPAAAQPTLPVEDRGGDPGEALDQATPRPTPGATDVGSEVADSLEGAGEVETGTPKVDLREGGDAEAPAGVRAPPEEDIDDARLERRRRSHQVAIEETEPRPPLPPIDEVEPPPWARRIEIGGHFAFVIRPLAGGVVDTPNGYDPAPGWGIHLHWNIVDWFRFSPYFLDSHHVLNIPPGGLAQPESANSISPTATIESPSVSTFSFGAKLQPTWNINDRLRTWATVGVGWGRFEFPVMTVTEGDQVYDTRERSGVFVEFPLGVGISFDIIERWLAVEYEALAAPATAQSGDAHKSFQATSASGEIREVGPFGAVELSIVQTLGLSLIF